MVRALWLFNAFGMAILGLLFLAPDDAMSAEAIPPEATRKS